MAIFEDILYPGNPKRREEVRTLTNNCRNAFLGFKEEWNNYANTFNKVINQVINQEELPWKDFKLPNVSLNPDNDKVEDMVNSILEVVELAKQEIAQFNTAVQAKLNKDDAEKYKELTDFETIGVVEKWVNWSIPTLVSGGIATYLGIGMSRLLAVFAANGVVIGLGLRVIGYLSIGVLSVGGFIVSDLIVAAITGAIERGDLEEAKEKLGELNNKITIPLNTINIELAGEKSALLSGTYRLSKNKIVICQDGIWKVFELNTDLVGLEVTPDLLMQVSPDRLMQVC